jgi:hypothetical protein
MMKTGGPPNRKVKAGHAGERPDLGDSKQHAWIDHTRLANMGRLVLLTAPVCQSGETSGHSLVF